MRILRILSYIFIVVVLVLVIAIRENINTDARLESLRQQEEQQLKFLESIGEWTDNYNELYEDYNELYQEHQELLKDRVVFSDWESFEVTAYTSLDEGCNNISAIGMNIEKWNSYFNFCAVDPEVIPLGSVVLIRLEGVVVPFLAVDVGGAIKGNRIDLYCGNDLESAFSFGRVNNVDVRVLE
jgi:3D (Asp-Asp-Asp) domain-containing protein